MISVMTEESQAQNSKHRVSFFLQASLVSLYVAEFSHWCDKNVINLNFIHYFFCFFEKYDY